MSMYHPNVHKLCKWIGIVYCCPVVSDPIFFLLPFMQILH